MRGAWTTQLEQMRDGGEFRFLTLKEGPDAKPVFAEDFETDMAREMEAAAQAAREIPCEPT